MAKTNMDFESFVEGILDTINQYSAMQKNFSANEVSEKPLKSSNLTKHLKEEGLDAETLRKKLRKHNLKLLSPLFGLLLIWQNLWIAGVEMNPCIMKFRLILQSKLLKNFVTLGSSQIRNI